MGARHTQPRLLSPAGPLQIRALVSSLKAGHLGSKFGVAALPRHLRRRAGSHKPWHRHHFRPNAQLQGKRRKLGGDGGGGVGLDEQASGDQDTEMVDAELQREQHQRPTNRRMRRQAAALQQQFSSSTGWAEGLAAPADAAAAVTAEGTAASVGSAAPRRLETHVWHAKRLAMEHR